MKDFAAKLQLQSFRETIARVWANLDSLDLRLRPFWFYYLLLPQLSLIFYDFTSADASSFQMFIALSTSTLAIGVGYLVLIQLAKGLRKNRAHLILVYLLGLYLLRSALVEASLNPILAAGIDGFIERLPGDLSLGLVMILALSELTTASQGHAQKIYALKAVNLQLIKVRKGTSKAAFDTSAQLKDIAQQALGEQLSVIRSSLTSAKKWDEVRAMATEIRRLIAEDVRPLSRRLNQALDQQIKTQEFDAINPASGIRFFTKLNHRTGIRIWPVTMLAMPNIVLTANSLGGVHVMLGTLLLAVLSIPILAQLASWVRRFDASSFFTSGFIISGTLMTAFLPVELWIFIQQLTNESLTRLLVTAPSVYLTAGLSVAAWSALQTARNTAARQLEELNLQLERETVITRQNIWLAHRQWAYLIHGTVQGALTVAASRLQLADEQNPADIKRIVGDLDRAIEALTDAPKQKDTFSALSKDISATWDGVLKIEVAVVPSANKELQNQTTARCVAEILKELAGNAYRHGNATRLYATIGLDKNFDLQITASNNGKLFDQDAEIGLGSKLFDELTMSWEISSDASGVNFVAILPSTQPRSELSQSLAD